MADEDAQLEALCAQASTEAEVHLCERVREIMDNKQKCTSSEQECDQEYLEDLTALYWAVRFSEKLGLLE